MEVRSSFFAFLSLWSVSMAARLHAGQDAKPVKEIALIADNASSMMQKQSIVMRSDGEKLIEFSASEKNSETAKRDDEKNIQFSASETNGETAANIQEVTHNVQKSLGSAHVIDHNINAPGLGAIGSIKSLPTDSRSMANARIERFFTEGRNLTVIVVGANDGSMTETNDPVVNALNRTNVNALMVEPNPPVFRTLVGNLKKFQESTRLHPLNIAVCPDRGTVPFYVVSPDFAKKFPNAPHFAKYELSAMDKKQVSKHWAFLNGIFHKEEEFESFIDKIQVPCWTPSDLMAIDHFKPQQVDLLMVDVEGMDAKVVTAFMSQKNFDPGIIIFENLHVSSAEYKDVTNMLRARGYIVEKIDEANTIAHK